MLMQGTRQAANGQQYIGRVPPFIRHEWLGWFFGPHELTLSRPSVLNVGYSSPLFNLIVQIDLDICIYIHIGEVGVDHGLVHLNGAPGCGIQHRR